MIRHLINGEWVESEETFENFNPATGEVLDVVSAASEAQVHDAVRAAKDAFPAWANMPVKKRAKLVEKLGDAIAASVDEISAMESRDTGLTISVTRKQLIPRAADNFYYFAEMSQRINGDTYPVDDQMLNYTLYQPVGVCGLISPWNVPFMTGTWKVAPAIALGNTAVLKMSELSPLTANRLGEIAVDVGIPPGVLNVIQGWGHTAGDALVKHPDVRVISFTGGTKTGETITRNAGLKRLSMELGGKSPVLVFEDADLDRALDSSLFTIFSINGERCTAGSRIFVQESIYDKFVEDFAARAANIRVGDPMDEKTEVGALISKDHFAKVSGYVDIARDEGARVLAGGSRPDDLADHLVNGHFLSPTVLADVDNKMRCAQEEIFGPVACLIPFKDEAHALSMANDNMYGLTAYLWTSDNSRVHRLSRQLDAGMVFVNSQNVRDLRQPFGGTKMSGVGREGGKFSLETFAEVKNICISMGTHHIPKWGCP
ncbi:MAG: 5-carboxymethyl-2-hydroxymuconate semialdehyde dehydrogenase [Gammaproteobacteria bacterium]|nr:5-carboxymethyl-2-hydroxymuconate semialdehyde dehydrogenase [Gammaproteobacteria bacterium]